MKNVYVFFPGWPRMMALLKIFLNKFDRKFGGIIVIEHDDEKFWAEFEKLYKNDYVIAITYSDGIRRALGVYSSHRGLIKKIIAIAPSGVMRLSFIKHIFGFCHEVLSQVNFFTAGRIFTECLAEFIIHPIKSTKRVNAIRRFNLRREIRNLVAPVIIFAAKQDEFQPIYGDVSGAELNRDPLSNHFSIVTTPDHIFNQIAICIQILAIINSRQ